MTKLIQLPDGPIKKQRVDKQATLGAQTSSLKNIDSKGRVFVDFPGNTQGPVGRSSLSIRIEYSSLIHNSEETKVLLVFDNNDLFRPVIISRVRDQVPTHGVEIHIHGHHLLVDSEDEIELPCGQGQTPHQS